MPISRQLLKYGWLKICNISFIWKKTTSDYNHFSNYRLISNPSLICKITKRVVESRLLVQLSFNNLFISLPTLETSLPKVRLHSGSSYQCHWLTTSRPKVSRRFTAWFRCSRRSRWRRRRRWRSGCCRRLRRRWGRCPRSYRRRITTYYKTQVHVQTCELMRQLRQMRC